MKYKSDDFFKQVFRQTFLTFSKKNLLSSLRIFKVINTIVAIALLFYTFGFYHDTDTYAELFSAFDWILLIYFLVYLTRLLTSGDKKQYLKKNLYESILLAIILVDGLNQIILENYLLDSLFARFPDISYHEFYLWFVVFFMSLIVSFEVFKGSLIFNVLKIRPSTGIVVSFLILIAGGSLLLSFPTMSKGEEGMPFLDALFTATSASCVTGLIVEDTATFFTLRGQITIMILIQLGGLGILSFATFFGSYIGRNAGIKQQTMMQDMLNSESLSSTKSLLKSVFLITLLIEFITFIGIYLNWGTTTDHPPDRKIFDSVFHAVSAFCNAGFSTLSKNLYEPMFSRNYMLHMVIILAVILGGLGFTTLNDLFSPSRLRDRLAHPWKDWEIGTKIAAFTTMGLLLAGMGGFILLEYNNTLKDKGLFDITFLSFFQSATTRTAGFNTVDISALREPTLLMFIILMFIGASSGSVGGGIKTSTFFLIIAIAGATIRNKSKLVIGKRQIPRSIAMKALTIFSFAALINMTGLLILSITEPDISVMDLAFEQFSAFGTVGLSTGVTENLSDPGKVIIIVSMLIGRVGPLTLALALSRQVKREMIQYPQTHIMIG